MADGIRIDANDNFAANAFVQGGGEAVTAPSEITGVNFTETAEPGVAFGGGGEGTVEAPSQPAEPAYVAQGYDFEKRAAQDFASVMPGVAERQQARRAEPAAQRLPDTPQATPEQAQQVMEAQTTQAQQARPSITPLSEGQTFEDRGVPSEIPGEMEAQSNRHRTATISEAVDAGDQFVERGIERAFSREAPKTDESDERSTAKRIREDLNPALRSERQGLLSRWGNAANRAMARMERTVGDGEKPWWMKPADRMIRFTQNEAKRPSTVAKRAKNAAARAFKRSGVGRRVYGKMHGSRSLALDEVGLGLQEIMAAIRQDSTMIETLLKANGVTEFPPLYTLSVAQVAKLINDNEIWVATFKPPNNQGQDIQKRKLRILTREQRGIYIHYLMAAMYTADYDGDDMEVSFDPQVSKYAKSPMDYMVDIYGKISLNEDFMEVANIPGTEERSAEEYVKEIILGEWSTFPEDFGLKRAAAQRLANLTKAIIELGETSGKDGDAVKAAYGKVFMEARKFSDVIAKSRGQQSDSIMSGICKAVLDGMRSLSYSHSLNLADGDLLSLDEDAVPKPKTHGDAALYRLIEGMVKGQVPNNFQELKLMLTGFTGNVKGKNAPFRFTADVGKMVKMDQRLMAGNGYVVKPNNDTQMELFFQTTVKFAGSLRMANEIKKAGHSEYYTQVMRQRVIEAVGFPEKYATYSEFLTKFAEEYNRNSAIINEANKVFLTNMGISSESNAVSPLRKTGKDRNGNQTFYTLSDLAEPFLSIYGSYSVGRMFSDLQTQGFMRPGNRDPFYAGNPNAKRRERYYEREYDFWQSRNFWITGKYISYNLRQFRNENHLVRSQEARNKGDVDMEDDVRQYTLNRMQEDIELLGDSGFRNVDAQFRMLMAIADKRTGAASSYNKAVFGDTDFGGQGIRRTNRKPIEKTTVRYMSNLLISISAALREGNQEIKPGYYAGIGNRKLPKGVKAHMTNVARRLANMGPMYGVTWTLRSGDAIGSDQAFQKGAGKYSVVYKASSDRTKSELSSSAKGQVVNFDQMTEEQRLTAYDSLMRLHPTRGNVKDPYVRDLMARDYYQVVGTEGSIDSAFVACYADANDGGTWQAIRVAQERGIPVFNAAEYDDLNKWEEDVIDAAIKACQGQLRTSAVARDQAQQIDEAISALIMANPDMFSYFNMDSTAAFLESSYGKKMLQYADDVEMLGGIYTSMVFDYRMERINALNAEFMTQYETQGLERVWTDLLLAKDELSSASQTWRAIIAEMEAEATPGMKSFFEMMRDGTVKQETTLNNGQVYAYDWNPIKEAADFWANPGNHRTLRSVIDDLDLDRQTKWKVIVDVVRYWNKDPYIKSYEIGYQMEIANDSSYSVGGAPSESMMRVHNEFEDAFNHWGKVSQAALQSDVDQAHVGYANKRGALMQVLERLDKEPWELVSTDPLMYADAILAVYDKTYAQTEKASQNPWTNAIYAALSFQQVGGYMNDVTRTDDRLLGLTAAESVTIHDVIHLLANPGEEMTVYSKRGEIGILSRDILLLNELGQLSGDIEADMWEFLSREPRIAASIRRHSACVMQNTDGEGYLGASNSISETFNKLYEGSADILEQTKYLMRDHPAYAAVISLALPGKNLQTRNARHRVRKIEDYLAYQLYLAASSDFEAVPAAEEVLDALGITRKGLKEAMRSDYDTFLERQGLDAYKLVDDEGNEYFESDNDADITYDYARERIAYYIEELRDPDNMVNLGDADFLKKVKPENPKLGGPDAVSAAAFWDVVQELSGAKTSVSTGIEGSETYKFAEWVSHIHAVDGYADLQTIDDNEELARSGRSSVLEGYTLNMEQWAGAWTSLTNADGSPVFLEVDEEGVSFFMSSMNSENEVETNQYFLRPTDDQLSFDDAKEVAGVSEIVVKVPEGYKIKDRSTDTHGTQVASLFAYMVSKRSNGAEAFNLKAKKAGIDGKDSITKKLPGGRRKVGEDGRDANFLEIAGRLDEIAKRRGIMYAQQELAQMMYAENQSIGYNDLTLANYMSIAELMLIEGDDGNFHLRSIEMLVSAIKHRIGSRIDEMTDEQFTDAVNEIVNDTSENGVGMALMAESLEGLDNLSPKTKVMQHDAIRQSSSIFKRNYDLISEIQAEAQRDGIEPLSPTEAESINDMFAESIISSIEERFSSDHAKSVKDFLSGYNVVGRVLFDEETDDVVWTIGPSNVLYIGSHMRMEKEEVASMFEKAKRLGMTVICEAASTDLMPDDMVKDSVPILDDEGKDLSLVLVPCFDMRLNGSEATPYKARFAIAQVDPSAYVVSVEDSLNEFMLGDAEAQSTRHLVDNMHMIDTGSQQVRAEDLFPNVFKNPDYRDCDFSVWLANGMAVRNMIADGVRCTIDYGAVPGGRGFDQRKKDVDAAVERYRSRFSQANADGILMGLSDCEPGDIVAWAEMGIRHPDGRWEYVLAPIIPFPLHGVKRQPEKFSVENIGPVSGDGTLFAVDWRNETSLEEGNVKYFDSSGGANKGMVSLTQALDESRRLLDGTEIDMYIAKASTDSRKVGTDRRIKTMITLMAKARLNGYNFARNPDGSLNEDAFPDNAELRERLSREEIPISEWRELIPISEQGEIVGDSVRFVTDDNLNAFITFECKKVLQNGGNPSDYLANVFVDPETSQEMRTNVMWEFEAMFEQGLSYEDHLLKFLHFVNPTPEGSYVSQFCPDGIEDTTRDALFRLYQVGGEVAQDYDRGVLQMRVPHRSDDGKLVYAWDNVYIGLSFFGEEYSGFSRPNVDGSSNFLDGMNTMSMYGKSLDGFSARQRALWATSDISRWPHGNGSIERA